MSGGSPQIAKDPNRKSKEEDVDNLMSAEEYAESCDEEPEIEED